MPPGIRPRKTSFSSEEKLDEINPKSAKTGLYICIGAIVVLLAVAIYFW